MNLTLKIAAGIVIGMLAAYILIGKFSMREYESKSDELYSTQELHTAANIFMRVIEMYFDENGALPGSLTEIECYQYDECVTGRHNDVYYISRMGEWMSLEPYSDGSKLLYDCETTVKSVHMPFDRRIRDCGKLDPESVPDFKALPE